MDGYVDSWLTDFGWSSTHAEAAECAQIGMWKAVVVRLRRGWRSATSGCRAKLGACAGEVYSERRVQWILTGKKWHADVRLVRVGPSTRPDATGGMGRLELKAEEYVRDLASGGELRICKSGGVASAPSTCLCELCEQWMLFALEQRSAREKAYLLGLSARP